MTEAIRIKPHHFVDIITSIGSGQTDFPPHPYGHAVHLIGERILSNRDVVLHLELGADDICEPCCHNIDGSCDDAIDTSFRPTAPSSKREYNLSIDQRWCERLDLVEGDRLTARELCERIRGASENLTGIYRENPPARIGERERNLKEGIARFLEAAPME